MKIFAKNFRGYKNIEVDLEKITFLIGDNSTGKSSILYMCEAVCRDDLHSPPRMNEEFGVSRYDYFSPYFEYDDVTFGFLTFSEGEPSYGKVLTVRKAGGLAPTVVRCTHWTPDLVVTLRNSRNRSQIREFDRRPVSSCLDLLKLHESKDGKFEKVQLFSKALGEPAVVIMATIQRDWPEEKRTKILDHLFKSNIKECKPLSPIRAMPERYYALKRVNDIKGYHFAAKWVDLSESDRSAFESVNAFGVESGLFDKLQVEKISEDFEDAPLVVSIQRFGQKFTLDQVGVGLSQVAPVLIESMYSLEIDNVPMLLQQPELHLHPVAQAAFGSYLYRSGAVGLRGVIETHSSFLVDRFRSEIRDSRSVRENDSQKKLIAEILFCESSVKGNKVSRVVITDDGKLVGEPDSFHEFFVDELVRTMI